MFCRCFPAVSGARQQLDLCLVGKTLSFTVSSKGNSALCSLSDLLLFCLPLCLLFS